MSSTLKPTTPGLTNGGIKAAGGYYDFNISLRFYQSRRPLMDWTPVYAAIATGIITALGTIAATMKVFAPQWLAAQLEEKKAQMIAERNDRESAIMAKAEEAAYERNRRATHEDRTHEMLSDTLEFIKERMKKDDEFRERQLDQFAIMAEGIRVVGNRYSNLYAAQTITNQQLAVLTDSVRQMTIRNVGRDNGNNDSD